MNEFVNTMDNLPKLVKVLLALPMLDIVWVVYRLIKSVSKKNVLAIVLAVVMLFVGIPFLWLVDMITIIASNKVLWLD